MSFCLLFQLMPVERYAVAYVEKQQAPMTRDELQKAEVGLWCCRYGAVIAGVYPIQSNECETVLSRR